MSNQNSVIGEEISHAGSTLVLPHAGPKPGQMRMVARIGLATHRCKEVSALVSHSELSSKNGPQHPAAFK